MIESHTLDAWTLPTDTSTTTCRWAMLVAGMGAPIFLFLAGVSVSLASGSRARRAAVGEAPSAVDPRPATAWAAAWPSGICGRCRAAPTSPCFRGPASCSRERRINLAFSVAGLTIAVVALGFSYLPSPYAESSFWTSAPSFFFIRTGILVLLVAIAYLWAQRPTASRFSPLRQFGVTSLFIYWIHVALVYGVFSRSLQRRLPIGQALLAFAAFTLMMFALSMLKTRWSRWWAVRHALHGHPAGRARLKPGTTFEVSQP